MGKKSVTKETRDQIVALHTHASFNNTDIGKKVGVSEKFVRTTLKNFKKFNSVVHPRRPLIMMKWIFRQTRLNIILRSAIKLWLQNLTLGRLKLVIVEKPSEKYWTDEESVLITLQENPL